MPPRYNFSELDIEGLDLEINPDLSSVLEKYEGIPEDKSGQAQHEDIDDTVKDKKKSWHQRRLEEILRLRGVANNLSEELRWKKDSIMFIRSRKKLSLMEDIAWRQQARLQISTEENSRLRQLVHHRKVQIKTVERAFRKRIRAATTLSTCTCNFNPASAAITSPIRSSNIFNDLVAGMDEVHVDLDNCFKLAKMENMSYPWRRNDSMKNKHSNTYLELLDCYAVPFGLQETEQAIWVLKTTPMGQLNALFTEVCSNIFFARSGGSDENNSIVSR
ncbi:unnamed protein product [Phytophthora fragariaefolia]|uniref:Unnamed protein product n=1 Tax=Phytophthora fragariaefolia TaxID=1490495 RepID=A0A9W6X950_9STRA|nr:unnamed protein product [Phytophthora fragariaefolia]